MATIHASILDARTRLERAGIPPDEAALDADLLARHALGGWDRGRLLARWREPAPDDFPAAYEPLIARREQREPSAYIIGHREFWNLEIAVEPGVLIPRPETEFIIEEAVARQMAGPVVRRIADVGTGSGCLAVALARAFPSSRVVATDLSPRALDVAARNAAAHGVAGSVDFVCGDLFEGRPGPFDLVVSNPPYIPKGDLSGLQAEVRQFEPEGALVSGADGLDLIRRLVPEAAQRLVPGGWLIFEFGFGQAEAVRTIIGHDERLVLIGLRHDLAGIPRIAIAQRTGYAYATQAGRL